MCAFKCEDLEYVLPQPFQVQRCGVVRLARPLRFGGSPSVTPGVARWSFPTGPSTPTVLPADPFGRPGPRRRGVAFAPVVPAPPIANAAPETNAAAPETNAAAPTPPATFTGWAAVAAAAAIFLRCSLRTPEPPFVAAAIGIAAPPPLEACFFAFAFPLDLADTPCFPLCVSRRSCSSSTKLNDVADMPSMN